jgi:hypothetical protein
MACAGILITIIVIAVVSAVIKEQQLANARAVYRRSLAQLQANPVDPNLRQQALTLGRRYSYLMRNKKGITMFDEMKLMNDINAACADTVALIPHQLRTIAPSVEDRLEKLGRLRAQGLITENEYSARRETILHEI